MNTPAMALHASGTCETTNGMLIGGQIVATQATANKHAAKTTHPILCIQVQSSCYRCNAILSSAKQLGAS